MLEAETILERIDRCIRELEAIKAELMPAPQVEGNGLDDPDALIDTTSAAARFSLARDTVAKACREIPGVGVWKGGRWQVRIEALRQHLDRKNNQ